MQNEAEESDEIVVTDPPVRATDTVVRTADDLVETTDEVFEPGVITGSMAAGVLRAEFGALLDAGYLQGKTSFRDALCARLDLSQLTAEELCDGLERSGILRFVSSKQEGEGWHIHDENDERDLREPAPEEA